MKKQIKICLMLVLVILIFSINNKVNAAIAIKEAGTSVLTEKTISEFFDMAQQMTQSGQALEGTSLDPHMATNKEWAAVSYLSNSNYGTAGEGQNTGITVTINGNSHYSTTDNITGVIDWGRTHSFTAGILSDADTKITDQTVRANGQSLITNIADDSKVDKFDMEDNSSIAVTGWFNTGLGLDGATMKGTNYDYPYSGRKGLFHFQGGRYNKNNPGSFYFVEISNGAALSRYTFRPVL